MVCTPTTFPNGPRMTLPRPMTHAFTRLNEELAILRDVHRQIRHAGDIAEADRPGLLAQCEAERRDIEAAIAVLRDHVGPPWEEGDLFHGLPARLDGPDPALANAALAEERHP